MADVLRQKYIISLMVDAEKTRFPALLTPDPIIVFRMALFDQAEVSESLPCGATGILREAPHATLGVQVRIVFRSSGVSSTRVWPSYVEVSGILPPSELLEASTARPWQTFFFFR